MTGKMLDAVGAVVIAIVITKSIELYGEWKYNKGFEEGRKENK